MVAALRLAESLFSGGTGPFWSVEEVRGLLATAKSALAKFKPWMPLALHAQFRGEIADDIQSVNEAAACSPEQAMTPVLDAPHVRQFSSIPRCSGCGRQATSLKKCSRCRVAAYCSRACQVHHWKEGGHKQECAQLEAGSGGAGGSSAGS